MKRTKRHFLNADGYKTWISENIHTLLTMNYKKEGFTWELATLYVEIEKKEKATPFTCNANQNAK